MTKNLVKPKYIDKRRKAYKVSIHDMHIRDEIVDEVNTRVLTAIEKGKIPTPAEGKLTFVMCGLEEDMRHFTLMSGITAFTNTELTGLFRRFRANREIKAFISEEIETKHMDKNLKEKIALTIATLVEFAYDHKKMEKFSKFIPVYGYNDF